MTAELWNGAHGYVEFAGQRHPGVYWVGAEGPSRQGERMQDGNHW